MEILINFLLSFYGPTPYLVVFGILLACGLGLPIPEDITLFAAALLAYYGVADIGWMIVLCLGGVILGDSLIFYLGSRFGRKLTQRWIFRRILPEDRLLLVQEKFKKSGLKLLFFARFMPGLRAPVFFSAGTLHVPYSQFLIYNGGAAVLSVPAIVGAVYYFGDELDVVVQTIKHVENGIVLAIVAVVLFFVGKWYWNNRRAKRKN